MISAKSALLRDGKIEAITRGRMSLVNTAYLKGLYDNGERFTDWPKGKFAETVTPDAAPVVRVVRDASASGVKEVIELAPMRYDERDWKAVTADGEVFGMREVCTPCGYSLVGHGCNHPQVHHKPVTIVSR